ncbi:MAG: hypothetical protein HRT66_12605 [Flavobacteriaceae bacterium]|nr:hypothetical protein [Flavobacteriaceae bacterium]
MLETGGQTRYYIRDASGSVMAIYKDNTLKEHPLYGSSRLGVFYKNSSAGGAGVYNYQLTDHLGNVRAVIARADTSPATATDYYPFGMAMPERTRIGGELYRYNYQGQEKDSETGKEAFELRLWDSRIGRWLTTDPYGQFYSPYLGMGNNPVMYTDSDGGWVHILAGAIIGGVASGILLALEPGDIDWYSGRTWSKIALGAGTGAAIAALPISATGAIGGVGTRLIGSALSAGAISTVSDLTDQAIDIHNNGGNVLRSSEYNFSNSMLKGAVTGLTFGIGGQYFQRLNYKAMNQYWGGSSNSFVNSFYKSPNIGAAAINSSFDFINFNMFLDFNSLNSSSQDNVINLPEIMLNMNNPNNGNILRDHINNN